MSETVSQPILFEYLSESATSIVELFPKVWTSLELLVSPDGDKRHEGIDQLLELDAIIISPLVAYVAATRILDPDIEIRYKVIQALGEVLSSTSPQTSPSEAVRASLKGYFSQMRRREVFSLLQVSERYPSVESNIVVLLNSCSYAGNTLAEIFLDRRTPISIRRHAITYAGRVGFLDTIPALEKLAHRLDARSSGQRSMPFAPPSDEDEKTLLPAVQTALTLLKVP